MLRQAQHDKVKSDEERNYFFLRIFSELVKLGVMGVKGISRNYKNKQSINVLILVR